MTLPVLGQDIAAFSGTKTPTTATVPNISAEALSRGPGLTVSGGPTFNSGNWTTDKKLDSRDYIQWSVSADPGYILNINELQINFDRDPDGFSHFFTGNGPAKIRIRTSLDDFKSDIYAHDKVSNSGQSPTIETSLRSAPGDTITFRLYGFASNIGLLGPLGTLDIEGGLGTVLGLENTGIRLAGKITYDGLQYNDGTWTPRAPNANTGDENVLIYKGIYTETNQVEVKNLRVNPEAGIVIKETGAITVNGNLYTANNVTLHSEADQYSSLMVTGDVTGTAKYQRQMKTKTLLGGSGNELLISAPVMGEAFDVFRAANPNIVSNGNNSLFLFGPFDKTKADFTIYSKNDSAPFKAATGYKAASTNNGSFTFNGTVSTNEVHKEILHSDSNLAEWNLIGNPYPSYFNTSDFLNANMAQFAPASSGIYTYNGDPSLGWNVYNLAYLTLHPQSKITPGQGFMVASKHGGGMVSFRPDMRSSGKSSEFTVGTTKIDDKVGYLRLNMTSGVLNYNTEFYFNAQSTKGLDPGYDAGIYGGKAPDFAVFSHLVENNTGLDMAVQSLSYADLADSISIPLGLNASKDQHLTIKIAESILPEETEVFLEDTWNGTFTLLNRNDYHFTAYSDLSDTGRFFLHILNNTLSYGSNGLNGLQIFTSNASQVLHIKGMPKPDTIMTIYDSQGRLLFNRHLDERNKNNKLDISSLSAGMYIAKLRSGSMEKIKKIMITQP
ncbi:T9SS type A sorting domain-containing protein [Gelidibacter pelagius]|uniref:T9SS type A sorting domain-containing protein n=1 Tax=Gelidibacter pelagius TaxID=2819985 RepID=A0ABS3SX08_9FLAO|nr:T9SS type A sorting domain-containing protein [Gelidibacter pelagius]MBO3100242.1 T9SS type A sorting domain-containing protein [Gelidibacter pelagius]